MESSSVQEPHPAPVYVLLVLSVAFCAFFFWIGTVCVRLWFYKGALGPEPEKFIILSKDLKARYRKSMIVGDIHGLDTDYSNRNTVLPYVISPDTAISSAVDLQRLSRIPPIDVQNLDDLEDFEDPELRAYIAEEYRVSRLPAFVQDDCGDGSEFPDVPFASEPIESHDHIGLEPSALGRTSEYLKMSLKKVDRSEWLTIDNTYIEYHSARTSILSKSHADCIQVTRDAELACEELMHEVVEFLVEKYPSHFSIQTKHRRKHVRNELSQEEFSLAQPYDCHPLEVCARLAMEDFQILIKGDFTMNWYLQASATVFPAGWHMRKHIGKSLDAIVNNVHEPMPLWERLPDIFKLPAFSPYSFAPSLLRRVETYIQTQPLSQSPSSHLHIQRPADFFAGQIQDLLPTHLYIRREHQTFRRLPRSGAIVLSCKTEIQKLTDLTVSERQKFLRDVRAWDDDAASFKGRDLWITAVEGWCLGRPVFRDDATVFSTKS